MVRFFVSCCVTVGIALGQTTIPAGAEFQLRLTTPISTTTAKSGQSVEAVTIQPVIIGEKLVLPAGITVKGTVAESKAATKPDERATLKLNFNTIGNTTAKTVVTGVEDARESVDESGRIVGILASETIAARIDQGIGKLAKKNAGLADLLSQIAHGTVTSQEGPSGEIQYGTGVELQIRLLDPLQWKHAATEEPLQPIRNEEDLAAMVIAQPFQTIAENPPKPSDITNLMFIGSEQELSEAFKQAGWVLAAAKNSSSILQTMRAITEVQGYKEAPMSKLLLDGKVSDFDYQKQNNTFAKRHHLRIWRRPETFDGKPVWISSSTHDIGIEFSQENKTFIHVIDSNIDRERAKVVSDLLFTKKVKSIALVERPAVPKKSRNATGDNIETDGRIAVLVLQ